jgi:hypothetical protein
MRKRNWAILAAGVAGLAAAAYSIRDRQLPPEPTILVSPTTAQSTPAPALSSAPATVSTPQPIKSYSEWLKRQTGAAELSRHPRPLALHEALHVRCPQGAVISSNGWLWVIDEQGLPFAAAQKTSNEPARVTRDRVVAVFDSYGGSWAAAAQGDGFELRGPAGQVLPLARRDYDWSRARVLEDTVAIVPCLSAVSAIQIGRQAAEEVYEFEARGDEPVQLVSSDRTAWAYLPQHNADAAPAPLVCYGEKGWQLADGPPRPLLHVQHRGDTLLCISPASPAGTVRMERMLPEPSSLARDGVLKVVDQLSDDDAARREQAENALRAPMYWPLLEELLPQQPLEARVRMQELLAERTATRIGSWQIVDGQLKLQRRLREGAVFFAPQGARARGETTNFLVVSGRETVASPTSFAAALREDRLIDRHGDRWIERRGDQFFLLEPLGAITRRDEAEFSAYLGATRAGFLLGRPGSRERLYVDLQVADTAARLPGWDITLDAETGWDSSNWPATRKEGDWSLRENGWRALDTAKEPFLMTLPTTRPGEPMSLADGTIVTGGRDALTISREGKGAQRVLLEGEAAGTLEQPLATLVGSNELLLYNHPGRIVRLRCIDREWKVFKVHDRHLPQVSELRRFWTDPAGRVCMLWENRLMVLFPDGVLPRQIRDLMPVEQLHRLASED